MKYGRVASTANEYIYQKVHYIGCLRYLNIRVLTPATVVIYRKNSKNWDT